MNQNSGKTKTIIWVTLLLAVVVIGIGYAAISATNLNISGTASATGDTTDFVVKFDDSVEIATAGQGTTSGDIVNNTTATMTVEGLSAAGEKASATYTIKNESQALSAGLTAQASITNTEYFDISYSFGETSIATGDTTTLTVTVTLKKTVIEDLDPADLTVTITATPKQP